MLEKTLNIVHSAMVLEPTSAHTQKYRQATSYGASRYEEYKVGMWTHMLS